MYSPVYGQDDFADDYDGGNSYTEDESHSYQPPPTHPPSPQPQHNPQHSQHSQQQHTNSQPTTHSRLPNSQSYAAHTPIASNLSNNPPPLLDAHLDDITPLLDILRCLQLDKPSTSAASAFPSTHSGSSGSPPLLLHCKAMPQGLKLIVNRHKTLSARGYLKANLFSHYQINTAAAAEGQQSSGGASVSFTVSLRRLLSVLEVNAVGGGRGGGGVGSSSSMGGSLFMRVMAGAGSEASEVVLELTDEGSVTTCQLACVVALDDGDEEERLQFAAAAVVARGTIPSHVLHAVLSELVLNGADTFTLAFQNQFPQLRAAVLTEGVSVLSAVGLPTTSPHSHTSPTAPTGGFTDFTFVAPPTSPQLRLSYPLPLITAALTVLALSEHTNVRVNEAGLLSLQNVIATRMVDVANWVELVCAAREDSGADGELTGGAGKRWGERLFREQDIMID